MIDKEMIESIKDAIDSLGVTTYGDAWDSALVEGVDGERYHAITNNDDVVVRADDDNRHSSWLCDYLELVSPVNMLKLIAQLEAAQKERDELITRQSKNGVSRLQSELIQSRINSAEFKQRAKKAEAELSAANEKLNKPVVLDKYWIEPAIHWNEEEEVMPVDEIIKAIEAAGFTVEGE